MMTRNECEEHENPQMQSYPGENADNLDVFSMLMLPNISIDVDDTDIITNSE